ncbi:30S ribosomal protein S20 [Candidatus Nitrospira inopinata]|jgi:small subunit ribosomal protein S20|uniref:Small ribosomal subunit protein bS20 n=1 Tax=Candidatus Nitrospira inopinata TaxID=1715989 RepID=A0A0S4KPV8_9BACT|nr:30S ribosomal protein S20 [Candidatus Nitrospira inopinata]CUQ66391.1 30S ribosomal protein S20 [Candidatus Nitrospira inopinata]
MPVIHKSTIRRARQAERRRERNRATMNTVKTITKKVLAAVTDKKADDAASLLREAVSTIRKAASKGVLKRNTASRRISRLTLRVNALSGSRS